MQTTTLTKGSPQSPQNLAVSRFSRPQLEQIGTGRFYSFPGRKSARMPRSSGKQVGRSGSRRRTVFNREDLYSGNTRAIPQSMM